MINSFDVTCWCGMVQHPGQEDVPGTMDNHKPVNHGTVIPAYISRGKAVLRVTPGGKVTRYPSVSAAAQAAMVKQPTMSAWIQDGKEHHGAVWKTEK